MNDLWAVLVGAIAAVILPEAALGASIGSLFFMLAADSEKGWRKSALLLVGWFVGYFAGTPFVGSGWSGLISTLCSAFAVVIMLQTFESMEDPDGTSPKLLDWAIDAFNKIRRG